MHIIKKRRIIPTDIAVVTQWNEAKRLGIASINGFNFFVDDSALCEPYKTPKVGDKIIVYKYRKISKRMVLIALAVILIVIVAIVIVL
ncbi:hypothetical protein [Fibrobacter succinogenes]|uniref:hypothetical protein n=1 Tax=Fibrobacter succinogenes TaxID=833 RepID=UPI001569C5D7|nr:hypothetical protein [Fibrobacter succinogenes]